MPKKTPTACLQDSNGGDGCQLPYQGDTGAGTPPTGVTICWWRRRGRSHARVR